MSETIEIDGVSFPLSNLDTKGKELLAQYQFASKKISELENISILLQRAKNSYIFGLKEEMVAAKAGLILGDNL